MTRNIAETHAQPRDHHQRTQFAPFGTPSQKGAKRLPELHVMLLLTVVCTALLGCSMQQGIQSDAVSFNLAQEEAANQQLLLNILRAKDRRPMHFTAMSLIRGNLRIAWGASATAQVPSSDESTISVTPSYSWATNPSFDLAILDSEKFMRGIMTPIDVQTFQYYSEQGWRKDVLLHLFVKRLEKLKNGKVTEVFDNYPDDPHDHELFKEWVDGVDKVEFATIERWSAIGSPIPADRISAFGPLIETHKGSLEIADHTRARDLLKVDEATIPDGTFVLLKRSTDHQVQINGKGFQVTPAESASDGAAAKPPDQDLSGKIYLRSPEAILYYLGELARAQVRDPKRVVEVARPGGEPWPLFKVEQDAPRASSHLSVAYRGHTYTIPEGEEDAGRSMQVLWLVSQLLALHKSADELPATRAVTVVGQ